jgi:hypothetical protein
MRSKVMLTAAVLVASLGGCTGTIGGGPGDETRLSESALCVVDTPIRRMTRFEYNSTVRDLLGDTTEPANVFPPEEEVAGFNNQAAALQVSELLAEQYMKVAEGVSERATANMAALMPDCDPSAEGEEACAVHFIDSFGRRAFRRPLDASEAERFKALYDFAIADADLGTFEDGIQLVIQAMLQSPHFLYRPEFGGADPIEGDVVRLTSWEMASKLSYMLWNTMPDEELFRAAEADELTTKEQIAAQAQRMLQDARAKDMIRNFHRQWLLLTHIDTISKDTTVYPAYTDALRPLWQEETEAFIEQVIVDGDGSLRTLFTAPYSMMNAELATFYGEDVTGAIPAGTAFERVDLDPTRRAGLLTQGALMATHAKGDQSSPVFRGKFVREQLMCQALPIPPANLVITPPELDSTKTTREQFEEIGANAECASCHNLMNPVGFGFEHYDGIGLWRDTQNNKPIDATGEIIASEDLDGTFDGAVELAQKLAGSTQVAQCVSSQWFRFANNRTVTEADTCSIETMNEAFAASGYNIRELLVAITQTEAFLYRHRVVAEGGAP